MSVEDNRHDSPYRRTLEDRKQVSFVGFGDSAHRVCKVCRNTHIIPHPSKPDILFCVACGYESDLKTMEQQQQQRKPRQKHGGSGSAKTFIESIDQRKRKNKNAPSDLADGPYFVNATWGEDVEL